MVKRHEQSLREDPWHAGWRSFQDGIELTANPFEIGTKKYGLWFQGWCDAEENNIIMRSREVTRHGA